MFALGSLLVIVKSRKIPMDSFSVLIMRQLSAVLGEFQTSLNDD
jgi:hypothetical protein